MSVKSTEIPYVQQQLDTVLDIGFASSAETAGFSDVKHDPYLEALQSWLHSYGPNWAEQPTFSITQGLIDRGVDLKVEFKTVGYTVGFQVKSYSDIKDKEFSTKIWQQIGEYRSYNIDRLYVILCGDMTDRSQYQKVRRFIDQIEQGSYPDIAAMPPEQAWQLHECFTLPIDAQEVQKRSTSLVRFLHAIGRQQEFNVPGSVLHHLEQLYVPPTEYSTIQQTLEAKDIVIIVGAPHLGKTFTAVKLLYDYYNRGYQPHWMLGRNTCEDVQPQSLQDIYQKYGIRDVFSAESLIDPGCIVYFEDPYGRTEQEELAFVQAEGRFEIGDILRMLGRRSREVQKRPKVIITSREGIFRRATQVQPELSQFAVWLRAGGGMDDSDDQPVSYDFAARADIAGRYAHLYDPLWQRITEDSPDEAKDSVSEVISWAVSFLWTPHHIRRFFEASQNMDWHDVEALKKLVYESADISGAFASEIALMPRLEQLVFVIVYLTNYRESSHDRWGFLDRKCREKHLALGQALGFSSIEVQDAWAKTLGDYETIIERIEREGNGRPAVSLARFAHPAYDSAVARFLSDNSQVLEDIFAHIQPLLQSQPGIDLARDMVWLLRHWHQQRPTKEARILDEYLSTDDESVLVRLAEEYNILYAFTKNDALKSTILRIPTHPIAQRNNSPVRLVFVKTAHLLRDMSMERRCEVLLAGLGDNPSLIALAEYRPYDLICKHYAEVTEEAREALCNYVDSAANALRVVGRSLGTYYDHLPQKMQQVADELAITHGPSSFAARKELIIGLILGLGRFNNSARHLLDKMATSDDPSTRAYLASALVPVYDQLDTELQKTWHHLVETDVDRCVVAAAQRIIELTTNDLLADTLTDNGFVDFALGCANSDSPGVRAEMLRILLTNREHLPANIIDPDTIVAALIHDEAEIVRAAALYWMLEHVELQRRFPERFQTLVTDTSVYARLSKLLFYTNPSDDSSSNFHEVELLKCTESQFLYNALVFHIAAQLPFLPLWSEWLNEEVARKEGDVRAIVNVGKLHHPENEQTRHIFEPDWLLDYANPVRLLWYHPQASLVRMSSGYLVKVRVLDELNMILHLKQSFPDYLEC